MNKNILFISSWYPNKLEPTNGNFVQRHAEAVSLLHHVEVLHTIGDARQNEKFIFDDKTINGIRTLIVYYKNSKNPIKNFFTRMKAYQLGFEKMQKPDVVHGNVLHNNMLFAVYLKKKYKIPFVITEHWTSLQTENQYTTPFNVKFLAKIIGNHASAILPVSENLRKGLSFLGIKTYMKVIPNVIDTDNFDLKTQENKIPVFIHLSSLIPRKNPDKIINAAIELRKLGYQFILEIGGDGNLEPLKKIVQENGAQDFIKIFGELSYKEVAHQLKAADCFILFSEQETQGCVLLESFASGIPVISTNVGGVPEIVKPGFGILIEKSNNFQLLQAMKDFLEKKITFASPKQLREEVVTHFSKRVITEKFTEIYKQVLND